MTLRPPGSLRVAAAALLLALVAITLPLRGHHPRHVHEASTAGLYNEDHVLASLEFRGGDGPVPEPRAAAALVLVAAPCALADRDRPSAAPLRLAGSRAPPA